MTRAGSRADTAQPPSVAEGESLEMTSRGLEILQTLDDIFASLPAAAEQSEHGRHPETPSYDHSGWYE